MRAVSIDRPGGTISVISIPEPKLAPGTVLVQPIATSLCGTDIEIWRGTRPADYVRYPVIPGHEWVGRVQSSSAPDLTLGDVVVCEGMQSCGVCENCRAGDRNLCLSGYDEIGFTRPGGLADLLLVPRQSIHRVPDSIPTLSAALLEPAAVVAHAFLRAQPKAGDTVVVVGDGALGQIAVQMAVAYGARIVLLVGTNKARRELAAQLGAAATAPVEDGREMVAAHTGGRGADLVIETAGAPAAVTAAFSFARRGGSVVLTGLAGLDAMATLSSDVFVLQQLAVYGICGATPAGWDHAINLVAGGKVKLDPLIGARYPRAQAASAFEHAADPETWDVRVLITDENEAGS